MTTIYVVSARANRTFLVKIKSKIKNIKARRPCADFVPGTKQGEQGCLCVCRRDNSLVPGTRDNGDAAELKTAGIKGKREQDKKKRSGTGRTRMEKKNQSVRVRGIWRVSIGE